MRGACCKKEALGREKEPRKSSWRTWGAQLNCVSLKRSAEDEETKSCCVGQIYIQLARVSSIQERGFSLSLSFSSAGSVLVRSSRVLKEDEAAAHNGWWLNTCLLFVCPLFSVVGNRKVFAKKYLNEKQTHSRPVHLSACVSVCCSLGLSLWACGAVCALPVR